MELTKCFSQVRCKKQYVCYTETGSMVSLTPWWPLCVSTPALGCALSLLCIPTQWQAIRFPQLEDGPQTWSLGPLGIVLTIGPWNIWNKSQKSPLLSGGGWLCVVWILLSSFLAITPSLESTGSGIVQQLCLAVSISAVLSANRQERTWHWAGWSDFPALPVSPVGSCMSTGFLAWGHLFHLTVHLGMHWVITAFEKRELLGDFFVLVLKVRCSLWLLPAGESCSDSLSVRQNICLLNFKQVINFSHA